MELTTDTIDLLPVALDYRDLGFSVIPLGTNKQPAFNLLPHVNGSATWNPYRERLADDGELKAWFSAGCETQLGVLCGTPSNNLFVLDFDVDGYFDKFRDAVKEFAPDLHAKLKNSVITLTRKGVHVAVRCDSAVPGNEKLAFTARFNSLTKKSETVAAIETRGEGGYVVAAPSIPYVISSGSYARIVTLTSSELEQVVGIARSLSELPISVPSIEAPSTMQGQDKPGHWYNTIADETVLLESGGWTLVGNCGSKSYWRRPGKETGVSATFNHAGSESLFVFSNNAEPFEGQRSYSKFAIRTMLEFGGDWSACAVQCAKERGGEMESTQSTWEPITDLVVTNLPAFPIDLFPSEVRAFVSSVADSIQVPVDAVALSVLGVYSAVASRSAIVGLSESYSESLNNYYAVVLPPGSRKSGLHRISLAPLVALDHEECLQYDERMKTHKKDVLRLRKNIADLQKRATDVDPNETQERLSNLEIELEHETSHPPKRRCLLVDDCTPEELVSVMAESDETMAIMSAEGGVFGMIAGRYSGGVPNLDVYLKGHACDFLRVSRRSGDPITLYNPTLTMSLCLQPEVLTALESKQALTGRGLTARFIWSVPENLVGSRKVDTPEVPAMLRASYERDIRIIASWTPPRTSDGHIQRYRLHESQAAKGVRLEFAAEVERRLHPSKGDLNCIADWTGKLVGHMVRTAGLIHVMKHVQDAEPWNSQISAETMTAAVRFARYCVPHSLAAHRQLKVDVAEERAQRIADWLLHRETPDRTKFTLRDASRAFNWGSKETMAAPLAILADHAYIRPKGSKRGKDVTQYEVNPQMLAQSQSLLVVDDVDAVGESNQNRKAGTPGVLNEIERLIDGDFVAHLDDLEAQWQERVAA